uniref:heavy metal-binding domain-containing protein n=1 Tax=Marinilabilia sp. TaxID=2021252 RepID=UPI0025C61D48
MEEKKHDKFYCPMKCEGNKVYDKAGNCPVCNMHLVPVDDENHNHHHGEHKHEDNHEQHHHDKHKHDTGHKTHSGGSGKYYCPMHCEGEKTYDKPGDCPVCGMHLKKEEESPVSGSEKTIYTCPMHPEVKQDHPGDCPKCGMDLVPEKAEETSEEEKAYKKMAKKFWVATVLTIPIFIIAMSEFFPLLKLDEIASRKVWGWTEFILATPVVFYSSWQFFK